jgi:hypothetical protein
MGICCPKWCLEAYVDLSVVLIMCKWDMDAVSLISSALYILR